MAEASQPATATSSKREHDLDADVGGSSKRARLDTSSSTDGMSLAHKLQLKGESNEALVGISGYINATLPPFSSAVIKHRFTDFLVWEIDREGKVVRLNDIARPSTSTLNGNDEQEKPEEQLQETEAKLEDVMSAEKAEELTQFVQQGKQEGDDREMFSDPIEEKEKRKQFHNVIRAVFEGKLSTEAGEGGVVKISWASGGGRDRRAPRPSRRDQAKLPPYIQFTLHKTNRETQDCISQLASRLGVHPKDLGTAGTKDKRGVTTQLVTLRRYGRTIEEVWDTVNGLHHGRSDSGFSRGRGRGGRGRGGGGFLGREGMKPTERGERGLRIGDLKYVSEPLDLGHLSGNRFCIVLRNVLAPPDVISSSLRTLQETGFINFFGMQRFGNSSVPTHAVGLQLLLCNWAEAANLILRERDGDSEEVLEAREAWNTHRDAKKALQLMPKWLVAERCILEFFSKNGNETNVHGALSRIPKNLRMMYVHAYQSYLWNSVVSVRIAKYGVSGAVAGDLVYAEPSETEEKPREREGRITKESVTSSSRIGKVKVLTEEDKDQYSIQDVILPLPGYAVTYPGGELGELYRSMMRSDGLDADDLFRSQKEFSLSGAYRKIVLRPTDLQWSKIAYSDPNQDLVQPDEDAILGYPGPNLDKNDEEGDKLAIRVEFSLGTAAYATMALREVLKGETGNVQQRAMTEKMLDKHAKEAENGSAGERKQEEEIIHEADTKSGETPAAPDTPQEQA